VHDKVTVSELLHPALKVFLPIRLSALGCFDLQEYGLPTLQEQQEIGGTDFTETDESAVIGFMSAGIILDKHTGPVFLVDAEHLFDGGLDL
tara:strand:+ start:283 stop:555 length:273 start_codon:yes stop_codon:yes gene_type:complete